MEWLDLSRPEHELLHPLPIGAFRIERAIVRPRYPLNTLRLSLSCFPPASPASANAAGDEEESTDGFIAKFDLDDTFILASDAGGLFNAPWGFALAPSDYGPYSDMLLVGNFGDGSILALDMESMEPEGYVLEADGRPVSIDSLWDLAFGNGASLGRSDSLYFTAGPEEESHGLFGSLSVDVGDDAAGYFRGSSANDVHSGASGDDVIKGRGGDDTLMGQLGADYIDGGKGNDTIFGGSGDDVIEGSTGSYPREAGAAS
jgi:Ca2+-binding RTX toxin-like protein